MKKISSLAFVILLISSCAPDDVSLFSSGIDAYVPVYAFKAELSQIAVQASRPTVQAGKICAFGNFIFQNELYEGIHIIDNSDRNQPRKVAFLKVPMSTEIAVKANFLYTNNFNDLLVFDISDVTQPQLVNRVDDVFPPMNQNYPPLSNVSFECADPSKGVVVRWERKNLEKANCRR